MVLTILYKFIHIENVTFYYDMAIFNEPGALMDITYITNKYPPLKVTDDDFNNPHNKIVIEGNGIEYLVKGRRTLSNFTFSASNQKLLYPYLNRKLVDEDISLIASVDTELRRVLKLLSAYITYDSDSNLYHCKVEYFNEILS